MTGSAPAPGLAPDTMVVFAGGGTAGHVLPGIAVARALVERGHRADAVHFVVSEHGSERSLVDQSGFAATGLPGRGIQRRLTFANVAAVAGLVVAFFRAFGLIGRLRPGVVVVLGGFASSAAALAAYLRRVPIVVTEQNARAGLASRLAGRVAKASALPFASTDLPRGRLTGNPVRADVLAVDRSTQRRSARRELGLPEDRTVVVSFAGSLGSTRINQALQAAVRTWAGRDDLAVRHVVGRRDWGAVQQSAPDLRPDGLVLQLVEFEDRMDLLFAAADLAISRAGGTTVAELAAVGLPAILVPLPIAPRDHQTANAQELVEAGGAVLVPDSELDGARLDAVVTELLAEPGRLAAMSVSAASVAHRDAADRVADLIEEHARAR